jgi:hypothetical protein
MRLLCTIAGFAFGLPLIGPMRLGAQSSCQPVIDAMTKVVTTPTHISTTVTGASTGGKPQTTEAIYTGGASYVYEGGKWVRVLTKQEDYGKYTCRYLHGESVNGEMAAVYGTHAERSGTESDGLIWISNGQIWISKSRGLPLRQEEDIAMGLAKKLVKHHFSTRYEFGNIRPLLP